MTTFKGTFSQNVAGDWGLEFKTEDGKFLIARSGEFTPQHAQQCDRKKGQNCSFDYELKGNFGKWDAIKITSQNITF